ncbi:MAG: cell envelope integrity protein CreD [Muribaculaceae bacterium]|nr:cell envelope integrity protein CreD [Muribaculaceae bacterium]
MTNSPEFPPLPNSASNAPKQRGGMRISLKLLFMVLITAGLMIPDLIIYSMSSDREDTRRDTIDDINSSWSGPQLISGPILTVNTRNDDNDEQTAYILPSSLTAVAEVDSKTLRRSIYEAPVYTSEVKLSGNFDKSEFGCCNFNEKNNATVTIGIGDLKGLEEMSELTIGGKSFKLSGSSDSDVYKNMSKYDYSSTVYVSTDDDDDTVWSGNDGYFGNSSDGCLQVTIPLGDLMADDSSELIEFSFRMRLKGSQSLSFTPIGGENFINVSGNSDAPSFGGMFLPSERSVNDGKFSAEWRLNSNNRDYPQVFFKSKARAIAESAVVVNMLVPVDGYKMVDRSLKYAYLVILLTFITILFCELTARTPLYMFQYMLIGCALILFYSLLLSLVEHTSFGWSYLISAIVTIGMVTAYVQGVIKKTRMSLFTGSVLAIVYAFLYIIMCMETYALLTGTIGLFIALGVVMAVSLKVKQVYND